MVLENPTFSDVRTQQRSPAPWLWYLGAAGLVGLAVVANLSDPEPDSFKMVDAYRDSYTTAMLQGCPEGDELNWFEKLLNDLNKEQQELEEFAETCPDEAKETISDMIRNVLERKAAAKYALIGILLGGAAFVALRKRWKEISDKL